MADLDPKEVARRLKPSLDPDQPNYFQECRVCGNKTSIIPARLVHNKTFELLKKDINFCPECGEVF